MKKLLLTIFFLYGITGCANNTVGRSVEDIKNTDTGWEELGNAFEGVARQQVDISGEMLSEPRRPHRDSKQ